MIIVPGILKSISTVLAYELTNVSLLVFSKGKVHLCYVLSKIKYRSLYLENKAIIRTTKNMKQQTQWDIKILNLNIV